MNFSRKAFSFSKINCTNPRIFMKLTCAHCVHNFPHKHKTSKMFQLIKSIVHYQGNLIKRYNK